MFRLPVTLATDLLSNLSGFTLGYQVDEVECFLTNLSTEVQKRLKEAGLRGRRVTLKVMVRKVGAPLEPSKYGGHGICDNFAR